MSSTISQGLQSCLEPWLVEPRVLRLKLASPKPPHFSQSLGLAPRPLMSDSNTKELGEKCYNNNKISNNDLGGWSFIQALNDTSHNTKKSKDKESIYVHPVVKRASSILSKKSLELCTENLGCETGTNISENSSFSSSSSNSEIGNSPTREPLNLRQLSGHKKLNCRNFPPPLTSITSSSRVHVRSHREDGRLVIKAVTIPSSNTNFQAERSNGRLVLRFSNEYAPNSDYKAAKEEIEAHIEEEEAQQEENEELDDVYLDEEEMEGDNGNVRGEMGKGMFERLSRCKEDRRGNEGILAWEPCWVATS